MNVIAIINAAVGAFMDLRNISRTHPRVAELLDDLIDELEDSGSERVRDAAAKIRAFLDIPDDIAGDKD